MSLRELAQETLGVIEAGRYETADGRVVELGAEIEAAVAGTRLYSPTWLDDLLTRSPVVRADAPTFEVTNECSQDAVARLVLDEGVEDPVVLNFASAKKPGGGFLNGRVAQEEDVARCSALFPCLQARPEFYAANKAHGSALYTDHMIYSPRVPFFRKSDLDLVDEPFLGSVITSPAPNAGELRGDDVSALEETLRRRAGKILALAEAHEHRVLVLGAWGCGVFKNEPATVADAFARWLQSQRFRRSFERVVFAVLDKTKSQTTHGAFAARFG